MRYVIVLFAFVAWGCSSDNPVAQITEGSISDIRSEVSGYTWFTDGVWVQTKLINIGALPITKAYNVTVTVKSGSTVMGSASEINTADIQPGDFTFNTVSVRIPWFPPNYQTNLNTEIIVSEVQ
jgi:hypothetical protein